MSKSDIIKEAVDHYREGRRPQAFLILKANFGMNIADAKSLLEEEVKKVEEGDGETVAQEAALKEAFDVVSVFDDSTITFLRHMRETKQRISVEEPSAGDVLQKCAIIYDCMCDLIAHDVNPTRAMHIFLTKCCDEYRNKATGAVPASMPGELAMPEPYGKSMIHMQEATTNRLRDDLLTIL